VSTGFVLYALMAIPALALFLPIVLTAPMHSLLRVDADQVTVAREIAAIGFGVALGVMPLRVFPVTFMGMQQQHVGSIYRIIASVSQLGAMAASLVLWRGSLLAVVTVSAVGDVTSALAFAVWASRHHVVVAFRSARREHARKLFSSGLIFFVLNLANLFRRALPAVVIANAFGPSAVPPFSVPFSMFAIGLSVSELIAGSFLPAYGEAVARGDWPWIARAFRIASDAALFVAAGIAVLGAFAGADIVRIWAPKVPLPPAALFGVLGAWVLTQAASNTAGTLLCGLNRNWLYMWTLVAEGICTLGLGAWLVRASGILGVALAMTICGGLSAFVLNAYVTPRATDGNVSVGAVAYLKLLLCLAPAVAVGVLVRNAVLVWPTAARIMGAATAVGLAYGIAAWSFGLSASARAKIVERARRIRAV
jgi:O-antigen/teichoic acid export membrane protein